MIRYGLLLFLIIIIGTVHLLLNLNPIYNIFLQKVVWIALLVSIAIFTIFFLQHFAFYFLSNEKGEKTDLIEFITSAFLYTAAIALILKFGLGYDISAFLATSALITAILGLAMQATLSNIFAGISLHVEHPFNIGDYVRIPQRYMKSEGIIEAVRWRSIVIRRTDNSQVVIPNNKIAANVIEILPQDQLIRSKLSFTVSAFILPQKVKKIVTEILIDVKGVLIKKGIKVKIKSKDDEFQTIQYILQFYPDKQAASNRIISTIHERMWYAFYRNNIFIKNTELLDTQFPIHSFNRVIKYHNLLSSFEESFFDELMQSRKNLLFSHGERIRFQNPYEDSMFLIITGRVKKIIKKNHKIFDAEIINSIDQDILLNSNNISIEDEERQIIKKIIRDLTVHIGPFAKFITECVVNKFSDPYYWYQILSYYINNQEDRIIFLKDSPDYPADFYHPGDLIGLDNFILEQGNNNEEIYAQNELALVELNTTLLRQWVRKKSDNHQLVYSFFKEMMSNKNEKYNFL